MARHLSLALWLGHDPSRAVNAHILRFLWLGLAWCMILRKPLLLLVRILRLALLLLLLMLLNLCLTERLLHHLLLRRVSVDLAGMLLLLALALALLLHVLLNLAMTHCLERSLLLEIHAGK